MTQTSVRVEAALSGLRPGPHSLVIHTSGAQSCLGVTIACLRAALCWEQHSGPHFGR